MHKRTESAANLPRLVFKIAALLTRPHPTLATNNANLGSSRHLHPPPTAIYHLLSPTHPAGHVRQDSNVRPRPSDGLPSRPTVLALTPCPGEIVCLLLHPPLLAEAPTDLLYPASEVVVPPLHPPRLASLRLTFPPQGSRPSFFLLPSSSLPWLACPDLACLSDP
ncbi:hypothetical protein E2C01_004012 [Portunus trituberculatus]|uniref:Uncharacterized protein n=1 Tax=Portunus trituberculatus TaxID=210409 RepID=A0A5B7CPH9_PORTR|nr:hypothetical protein [Portunus trituberculatus]